jgi:FemAB-related protein (PEP-CTERM system-associated)
MNAADVRVETVADPPRAWDDFVQDREGTFCHLSGWARVFRDSLGLEPRYLMAWEDEGLAGVMPMVRMPRVSVGTVLVSVPYLNYGGPLGGEAARKALVEAAVEEARQGGDRRLEIRARSPTGAELPAGREKVTVVLDLPDDRDALFKDRFRSKLRSQIRRPMKEGMEPRFGPEERRAFYDVFSVTMRDLGTPVLPVRWFDALAEFFPDEVEFGAVYHEGTAVAAGCGFRFAGEFEMTWAAALWEYNRMAPNMLLYWSFMERCIEQGVDRFNFGRCTPGSGTHRFKSQWGGEDEPLAWQQWPASAGAPDPEGGVYGLATRLWRRLPLPVANRLGPVLARRIPTF